MTARAKIARRLKACERRYRQLCAALARIGPVKRGSLYKTYTGCGSPGCHCHQDPRARHGPYWYWTSRIAGKSQCRKLGGEPLKLYRRYTANYRTLKQALRRIERASDQILICQLQLAQAQAPPQKSRTRTK